MPRKFIRSTIVVCSFLAVPLLGITMYRKYIKQHGDISLEQSITKNRKSTVDKNLTDEVVITELDLSKPILTAVKTPVYATMDDSKKSICSYYPDIKLHLIQVFPGGWASMEHQGATVYVRTSDLKNAPVEEIIPIVTNPPEETGPVFSEVMGGYIGDYTEDGYLIVSEEVTTEGDVFARSGPSENHEKVKLLKYAKHLERVGIGDNGWSKVLVNGKVLYIASFYLSPVKSPTYEKVDEMVTMARSANLRNAPSIRGDKKGNLKKGESVNRIAIGSNGWSKILYKGEELFVYSLYLEAADNKNEPSN